MILTLESCFSAAHFYSQPKWSESKNKTIFGKCFSKYGHGHNYKLSVSFDLEPKDLTQKSELQQALHSITEKLDHHHLNLVIKEFKNQIPTTENLALYFQEKLKKITPSVRIIKIKLFETEDLWTEINYERR